MVRILIYVLHILTDVWCIIIGARSIFTPTHIVLVTSSSVSCAQLCAVPSFIEANYVTK